jgi:hypothetical protein
MVHSLQTYCATSFNLFFLTISGRFNLGMTNILLRESRLILFENIFETPLLHAVLLYYIFWRFLLLYSRFTEQVIESSESYLGSKHFSYFMKFLLLLLVYSIARTKILFSSLESDSIFSFHGLFPTTIRRR